MITYPPSCDPCDTYSTTTVTYTTTTTTPIADTGANVTDTGMIAAFTLAIGVIIWAIARRWEHR